MEIHPPHVLAKLPRSTKVDAISHYAVVQTSRQGIRRRKREICAAIDGDSLSIFELNNGNILASYPVPPTSSFSGPPVSIVDKAFGQSHRRTYCAIKRDALQIQVIQSCDQDSQNIKTARSPDFHHQDSPVVLLDLINSLGVQNFKLLVLQQDGTITMLSEDLAETISHKSISSTTPIRILAAQHLSMSEAQKHILKQRSDLISAASPQTSYLAVVYSRPDEKQAYTKTINYAAYAIDELARDDRVQPLFEYHISLAEHEARSIDTNGRLCTFSPQASHLYLRPGGSLITFDLSGLLPQQTSMLHTGFTGAGEMMAISPVFAISSHKEALRLFDLKYQTSQACIDLKRPNLKRKRSSRTATDPQIGSIEFITYVRQLGRVVARRRNQLVAIDIIAKDDSTRLLSTGTSLIQNIGQGLASNDAQGITKGKLTRLTIGSVNQDSTSQLGWQKAREKLDELTQVGDVAGFEDVFVDEVRKPYLSSLLPGSMSDDLPTAGISDIKYKYLLTSIFQLDTPTTLPGNASTENRMTLKVRLSSFRLILWLSRLGLLSSRLVQIAMYGTAPSAVGEFLRPDAVAEALVGVDPNLNLLQQCIENGFSDYVDEQAATVRMLIRQALSFTADESQVERSGDQSRAVARLAESQLQTSWEESQPNWVPEKVKKALVAALNKLGSAAASVISPILRTLFSETEILALVQFLRQQLFIGGHTRSFRSLSSVEPHEENVVNLDAVIRILSCCVDGIGPLGLVGTIDNEAFVDSIVPDLASEIASTKESLEDAAELQGILRETLRYCESLEKHHRGTSRPVQGIGQQSEQRRGTIVTLYSETIYGVDGEGEGRSLPLSLRAENAISETKVRRGGGEPKYRSSRQKSMLKQRQKGPYSFERLVL
ncbi:uncharacterized protein A1O9_09896 [Exophiala aquamarina CBS 119918]|uniref:Utp8 beta-propeller domain-containing protein n=1 Tax=Exophiala aquamarina CBS 119918 TaxID=1182545 RepID=A0A072P2M1_9EURO|nr:uncharacterized protein A1O9_09896 [Exophiala aquamarina CBS 119918]KEF54101.1 hypothetical protein A1O9_09896 [Exophiala aquamarina CBS 119918]